VTFPQTTDNQNTSIRQANCGVVRSRFVHKASGDKAAFSWVKHLRLGNCSVQGNRTARDQYRPVQ
jgi:hypothetical protein